MKVVSFPTTSQIAPSYIQKCLIKVGSFPTTSQIAPSYHRCWKKTFLKIEIVFLQLGNYCQLRRLWHQAHLWTMPSGLALQLLFCLRWWLPLTCEEIWTMVLVSCFEFLYLFWVLQGLFLEVCSTGNGLYYYQSSMRWVILQLGSCQDWENSAKWPIHFGHGHSHHGTLKLVEDMLEPSLCSHQCWRYTQWQCRLNIGQFLFWRAASLLA